MMDVADRISQFKNMTAADPDNEMGHFSLGKAYFDSGRYAESEPCFVRVLELNPTHSKSYQLLGEARLQLGKHDQAVKDFLRGYEIAAARGDVMPRDGIAATLKKIGVELPKGSHAAPARVESPDGSADEATPGGFRCSRCGRPSGKLPNRPFKGELGERVWASVCSFCWREWIGMGTKVINEMGLQLADPNSQEVYDEHMKEFLQIND